MEDLVKAAAKRGELIDITTRGARSGADHRIEIGFHLVDGSFYITGRPGRKRDWLANLLANPKFTVHLKHESPADLAATAEEVNDVVERSTVLYRILTESWNNPPEKADHILPRWVEGAPLVRFILD